MLDVGNTITCILNPVPPASLTSMQAQHWHLPSVTHQLQGKKKNAQSGLLVVDLPVAIDVRLADHLVDLLVRQLLAEVRHHVAQLGGADEAVAITVEHLF